MEWIVLILFISIILGILSGVQVAIVLGGVSFVFGYFLLGVDFFNFLPSKYMGLVSNYILIAIPLFIFMGIMLEKSGIAPRMLVSMVGPFKNIQGGLILSVILVGSLLAASTGIVGASVVTMGTISLPTLLKNGYSKTLATGAIAATGTLGQIIPPSIVLILLGSVLNVSIGKLFSAAILPGLILVLFYGIYVIFKSGNISRHPESRPADEDVEDTGRIDIIRTAIMPLFLIVLVLGSIFMGLASPTEASAIGAFGAIILAAADGKINFNLIKSVARETAKLTGMIFFIMLGAATFALVFRGIGADEMLTEWVLYINVGPVYFVLLILVIAFFAGFFLDFIEIIFILIPVVLPILTELKVDLLWFGILIAIVLQTSFLTPPFGFSIFYLKGVVPSEVKTSDIYLGVIPFVIIQLIVVGMVFLNTKLITFF